MQQRYGRRTQRAIGIAAIGLACIGISARPVAKKKHFGRQADIDHLGEWKACADAKPKPSPVALSASFNTVSHVLTLHPKTGEADQLYAAAFEQCFMDDADANHPPGAANQYEDAATPYVLIRLRPASHVHRIKKMHLTPGHGYIIGDYNIRAILNPVSFSNAPLHMIGEDHSALLWLGMDDASNVYVSVLDLHNFPTLNTPSSAADLVAISSGRWEEQGKDHQDAAFARWEDPTPHFMNDKRIFTHEKSWLSCDTGCCLALDISVL